MTPLSTSSNGTLELSLTRKIEVFSAAKERPLSTIKKHLEVAPITTTKENWHNTIPKRTIEGPTSEWHFGAKSDDKMCLGLKSESHK